MNSPIEVLITLPFPEELVVQLRSVSPRVRVTVQKASKPEEVPAELWQRVEVLYTDSVLPKPEQAPKLRWIQFHWAGLERMMDAPILQKPGLEATSLSGAAARQMAEYVLLMLLAFGHRLPDLLEHQKRSEWPKDRWKRFLPQELNSSTVGIVGYGSIGREVARLLHEFGATILASKRDVMHPEDSGYMPEGLGDPQGGLVSRLYPPQALRSMFKECDFVVVTVPLSPGTQNLIGAEELAAMKPSAYLIDVSRGGVVNHAALTAALRERRIAGAALDVFPDEPLLPDSPLWKLPNVIITPHISGITPHYDQRAADLFAENLHRYLAGLPLHNRVDARRGY
jgi:phosphoglycerate dehydrogenase-like enzyme